MMSRMYFRDYTAKSRTASLHFTSSLRSDETGRDEEEDVKPEDQPFGKERTAFAEVETDIRWASKARHALRGQINRNRRLPTSPTPVPFHMSPGRHVNADESRLTPPIYDIRHAYRSVFGLSRVMLRSTRPLIIFVN